MRTSPVDRLESSRAIHALPAQIVALDSGLRCLLNNGRSFDWLERIDSTALLRRFTRDAADGFAARLGFAGKSASERVLTSNFDFVLSSAAQRLLSRHRTRVLRPARRTHSRDFFPHSFNVLSTHLPEFP
ncbi:hypothetical protein [Paraburkholderia sp.]|jgi:hypothetical protein|uniref:hypothetical protein n=1 Tax=Paraburkholderia sp. TaxID=1926495 RepID=UPI002F3E8353